MAYPTRNHEAHSDDHGMGRYALTDMSSASWRCRSRFAATSTAEWTGAALADVGWAANNSWGGVHVTGYA